MFSDASATATLQAVAQSTDPLNPPNVVGGRAGLGAKELTNAGSLDSLAQEVPGVQAVEVERSAEIPPEVESFMESVEDHQFKAPQEVVVADATAQQPTGHYAAEPVIVLPTTSQKVQEGKKKGVTESIRWLAEWCIKMAKKFHGMVVYRDVAEEKAT
jgi:hypothetical protein